ncbi:MAG: EamA family transporter [Hyphomicrobiales bacterium]|nr:EamA family transporter [Hyphomicrobiales bacterium]
MPPLDLAAALGVILIWAFNFIAGKVGVGQFPALFMMGLRFALVAMLLSPFLFRPLQGRFYLIFALGVVFGCFHFGPLFYGLQGVDAGPAAIAIQLTVPFSALLAFAIDRERLSGWQIAGMVIAFAGVYLLAGGPAKRLSVPHFLLIVGAAFAWSLANVIIRRIGPISPFQLNAWVGAIAFPFLLAASALIEEGHQDALATADWRGWGAIAYMAIAASIIAYGVWYALIKKHAVNRIVPLMLLSPVLAVILAILILDEPFSLRTAVGGCITLSGVAMIQFLHRRSPQPENPGSS